MDFLSLKQMIDVLQGAFDELPDHPSVSPTNLIFANCLGALWQQRNCILFDVDDLFPQITDYRYVLVFTSCPPRASKFGFSIGVTLNSTGRRRRH